jgi:RES domain
VPVVFEPTSRFPAGLLAVELPAGEIVVRVHQQNKAAVFFGPKAGFPPQNRFDAPRSEYRTLYAAERLEGAFVESVLRRPAGRILRRGYVEERVWTPLRLVRTARLAKLLDEGLQFHRVDASVSAVDDYAEARSLALALYTDFPKLDGLTYRSRFNNGEICFAFFDRLLPTDLMAMPQQRFDAHPERVDELMALHGAVFDTSSAV